jgi:hypothetical protein
MSVRLFHAILGAAVFAWAGCAAAQDPDDLYGPEYEYDSPPAASESEPYDSYVPDPTDSYVVEQSAPHDVDVAESRSVSPRASGACSEFRETVRVRGELQAVYGTACEQADGSWKIISAPAMASTLGETAEVPSRPNPTYAYPNSRRSIAPPAEPRYRAYSYSYYPSYRPSTARGRSSVILPPSRAYAGSPYSSYKPGRGLGWLKHYRERDYYDAYGY